VGPALGGALVAWAGWRAVFLFNVPLTAVLALAATRFIPRLPRSRPEGRFDWPGAALIVVTIGALAYATIEGQSGGWVSSATCAGFAVGVTALAVFVAWERRARHPLIDVGLFARPAFTAANAAAFVVFVGAIVYFSAYFQQVQGRSAFTAGLGVSAIGVAFAVAASASGRLVGRMGPRLPMTAGLVLAGGATLELLRLRLGTGIGAIWWDFALLGAGVGLSLTPMTAVAMSAVGSSCAGMVSAIHNALRQVGQVFGVAVLGALVYARLPGGTAGAPLNRASSQLFVDGLHHALWLSGLALLTAALLAAARGQRSYSARRAKAVRVLAAQPAGPSASATAIRPTLRQGACRPRKRPGKTERGQLILRRGPRAGRARPGACRPWLPGLAESASHPSAGSSRRCG
jgi:MFS transporter, DHA2 family, methylenomycin A resistance protein